MISGARVLSTSLGATIVLLFGVTLRPPPVQSRLPRSLVPSLIAKSPRTGRPVQRVTELLATLPPELRENFTLIYRSRATGAHEVDAAHPRLVLFGADARTVLALAGNPAAPDYGVVDLLRYSDEARAFELSRYVLPEAAARDPLRRAEARHNGEPNPAMCLHCHGDDPRPIFDSYPLWPGFFGAVRDTFPAGSPDRAPYQAFLDGAARDPALPYHHLIWSKATPVPPYLDPALDDPRAFRLPAEHLAEAPNTRLGMALTALNRARISRKLEASPNYRAQRRQVLARLLDCVPDPTTDSDRKRVAEQLWRESVDRRTRLALPASAATPRPMLEELKMVKSAAMVRGVAASLGVDASDWSLSFDDDSLSAYDGVLGPEADNGMYLRLDVLVEMLRGLAHDEPRFARYFVTSRPFPAQAFGEQLDLDTARAACPSLLASIH